MGQSLAQKVEAERGQFLRRFVLSNGDELTDAELLELIIADGSAGDDARKLAVGLLHAFGGLGKLLSADDAALRAVIGCDENTILKVRTLRLILTRALKPRLAERTSLCGSRAVRDYCNFILAHRTEEEFHVLYTDSRHFLIADELMTRGTTHTVPVYPREVVRRALELRAINVILVHNHPSGDANPSSGDITVTGKIAEALATVNVLLIDHLVVASGGICSFQQSQLLPHQRSSDRPVTHDDKQRELFHHLPSLGER